MIKLIENYKGLPRSMYILFSVQVINRFGDFVVPFLTILLTQKLGFSFSLTGLIVMVASVITIPAAFIGGRYADKVGRKRIYIFGQGLAACSIFICGLIKNPILITVLLISSAFFNGLVRPALAAMVTDLLPREKRQLGSSLMYLGINIGVVVGPIVEGFLFNNFIALFFIGDAVTSFVAVIIVFIFIKETNPIYVKTKVENIAEEAAGGNLFQALSKRIELLLFLLIYILYSMVYTQHQFALPMMLNKEFMGRGPTYYGLLLSVNAITVSTLTIFIVHLTHKFRPLTNIIVAGIFYAIGFGMIGMINSFPLYIISTITWTVGEILVVTNFGVYLSNNSPRNFRARFSAVGSLSWAIGGAFGTSIIGIYIDYAGIKALWPLIFFIAFTGVVLMTLLLIYSRSIKN